MHTTDPDEPVDPADELMFLALGGGNEVGRSCHIIQYKGKTIMVSSPCCSLNLANANIYSSTLASIQLTMASLRFPFTMISISAQ